MIRRVFIVWAHTLFRETVSILLNQTAIEIVGISTNQHTALAEIESLKPDTIIIEETEDDTLTHVEALQILAACSWGPRLIRLSLEDNELWLYYHERRSINSSEEFLRIIQNT